MSPNWRQQLADYIRAQAQPVDKFSHQPRLYALACELAEGFSLDDDILYAACWLHDLGVFIGHRPEDPALLATWDNVAYAIAQTPPLLQRFGFPADKIAAVQAAIRDHHPQARPTALEAILLHDADLLELLGAVGLLQTLGKVGRNTRYQTFADLLPVLEGYSRLDAELLSDKARQLAEPPLALLRQFLQQAREESQGLPL